MEILYFKRLDSTQIYLIEQIKSKQLYPPVAIVAEEQNKGIGSRNNSWEGGEGNLFFSFAINLDKLPKDLPIASASIYFSFIMKEILVEFKDGVWLKWPNDLYYKSDKIGGTITKKIDNILVCGIGVNLQKKSNNFKALNLNIKIDFLLNKYFDEVETVPSWKHIFSKYAVEFENKREISAHINGKYKSLKNAILSKDGSLIINNKRVDSLR